MKQFLFILILILPITILSQNNINLKLTLSIGDKYLIERELNSVTTQDVMGEIQIIKKNDSSFYEFEIINKPTDSSYYIKITFKRIKSDFTVTDETIGFDTDSIDAEKLTQYADNAMYHAKSVGKNNYQYHQWLNWFGLHQ